MTTTDYIKANRRGSREAELSFENGWKAKHKIHRSEKSYNRKAKHKTKDYDNQI